MIPAKFHDNAPKMIAALTHATGGWSTPMHQSARQTLAARHFANEVWPHFVALVLYILDHPNGETTIETIWTTDASPDRRGFGEPFDPERPLESMRLLIWRAAEHDAPPELLRAFEDALALMDAGQ